MTDRLLSLAAGTVPELAPVDMVREVAGAGWPATGLWFDDDTWTGRTTSEVRSVVADVGITVLDLEPIFITPGGDHGDRMIDVAADIGASNVLVVGLGVEPEALAPRLGELGRRAASMGVTIALEFGPLFATPDLGAALVTVEQAGRDGLAVLVDALHLARSGGTPAEVAAVDPVLLPYAQLCDATAEPKHDLRTDALDDRLLPGDGELPLDELIGALPRRTAFSVELRSKALRTGFDPAERIRHVLDATRAALES